MEMMIRINLHPNAFRTVNKDRVEAAIIHQIVADVDGVESAVILRNDGFANILPDEDTRQSR